MTRQKFVDITYHENCFTESSGNSRLADYCFLSRQ